MIGGAIGDALGYQIEFDRDVKSRQVTKYAAEPGIISDDTQMTLFTATSLLWNKTKLINNEVALLDSDAVYLGYLDWYDTQKNRENNEIISIIKDIWMRTQKGGSGESISWIKDIPELNKRRAPGNTCLISLRSGKMGTLKKPINNSKGCGGVMRIAPCGILRDTPKAAGELAAECSAITHGHLLGSYPSYMCAAMINLLLYDIVDLEESVLVALKLTVDNQSVFYEEAHKTSENHIDIFTNLINKAIDLSKQDLDDVEAITQLGTGFVAEEALAIAIYACLKYQHSFEDAIICAVNHGGDSDSTGAIAGNILGTYLGFDNIPQYYVDNVELSNVILEIADDMHNLASTSTINKFVQTDSWKKKYIDCKL